MKRQDIITRSWPLDFVFIYLAICCFVLDKKVLFYFFVVSYVCIMVFSLIIKSVIKKNEGISQYYLIMCTLISTIKTIDIAGIWRIALGNMTTLEIIILIFGSVVMVLLGFYEKDFFSKNFKLNEKIQKLSLKKLFLVIVVIGIVIGSIIHKFLSPAEEDQFMCYIHDFAILILGKAFGILLKALFKSRPM